MITLLGYAYYEMNMYNNYYNNRIPIHFEYLANIFYSLILLLFSTYYANH